VDGAARLQRRVVVRPGRERQDLAVRRPCRAQGVVLALGDGAYHAGGDVDDLHLHPHRPDEDLTVGLVLETVYHVRRALTPGAGLARLTVDGHEVDRAAE